MADTERPPPHQPYECPRCAAHDRCVPLEVQLRSLLTDDFAPELEAFVPLAQTGEQAAAGAALAHAFSLFLKAYGVDLAGARLGRMLDVLRLFARFDRIQKRFIDARQTQAEDIYRRYQRGELSVEQRAAAEAERPAYDGLDKDLAWLKANRDFVAGVIDVR